MTRLKLPYETLLRYASNGDFVGAHHQFREVILDDLGLLISEKLLPAVPFGSDAEFPASDLLGQTLESALASATVATAGATAAVAERDAALADLYEAHAARDAALAQVETLTAQISALTAQPERPPGKSWVDSAEFLQEFTAEELLAIHTSQVPLIVQLLLTLLAWTGEVWSADSRISMGLQALVSLGVLTPERRAAILAE